MAKYINAMQMQNAIAELCKKYNISYGGESNGGFGYELSRLADNIPAADILPESNEPGRDDYKVKQLKKMLEHEESSTEEHYGARLSHWWGDTNTLTIDAGGLRTLINYYATHRINLENGGGN